MPVYSVTSPEGRTISMEGEQPPTDADIIEAFHAVNDQQTGGVKLDAYQKIQQAGQQGAMAAGGSDFLTSIASDPGGFLKSLPADALELVGQGVAAVGNALVEHHRYATGQKPKVTTVTRDAQGREQMQEEDAPLPFAAGKPLYEPQGTVLQPGGNDFQKLLSGFTTPEMLALFPFGASKAVQATFLAQTAPAAVEAAGKLVDPELSRDEKQSAATELLLNGLMTYGLGKHLASKGVLKAVPASEPVQTPRPTLASTEGSLVRGDTPPSEPAVKPASAEAVSPPAAATAPVAPAASEILPAPKTTPAPIKATPAREAELTTAASPSGAGELARPELLPKAQRVENPLTEEDVAQNAVAAGAPLPAKFVADNGYEKQLAEAGYELKGESWGPKAEAPPAPVEATKQELQDIVYKGGPADRTGGGVYPNVDTVRYGQKGSEAVYRRTENRDAKGRTIFEHTPSPAEVKAAGLANIRKNAEEGGLVDTAAKTEMPFKVGDKVLHEGQIKTVTKAIPGGDYIGVGNRAVKLSEVLPAPKRDFDVNYTTADGRRGKYLASDVADKADALAQAKADLKEGQKITSAFETERSKKRNAKPSSSAMGDPMGAPAIPATPPPPAPAGATMLFDARLPVTMDRTGAGSVSVPQVMQSLVDVQRAAGTQAGSIRTGRFGQRARGIFKPHEEIIRLNSADNIPTAVHEVGHALQQQLYGTAKSTGLKVLPAEVRRELVGLGKALYGSTKPAAGYTGEGFAEFMRYWLTTEDAAKVAPKTVAFFEGAVLPKYPAVAKSLADSRSLIDIWRRQGATERAQRQLVREPGNWSKAMKALGSLFTYQAQIDTGAPLKALSEAAAMKLGKPLPPSVDPFKLYSFKRGSAGATVERMVMNHMLDVWGNPVGPSLAEALAPIKGRRKEFGLYLFGKAAEMRWQQGKNPGIALEDAQHIKRQFDSPEFQLAAQKYYDWQNGLLDYVVQADPTMADTVAKMRGANDFYAPLARLIDPVAAKRAAASARSNPFMRMTGSGLPVKDIFDQTILNAARMVNRANKALVMDAVVKTAQLPGLGHLIEEIPRARVMEKVNVEKLRDQLEALGVDTTALPPDEILQYATLADAPKGSEPIVAVKRLDGIHWYQVDPRLYETLEGLQTFSLKTAFPNLLGLGTALDLMVAAPGRMFKLGVTGLRAPFSLITNPARDLPTALVQSSVNPAKFAAQYPGAMVDVIRSGLGGKERPGVQQFYDLGAHMGQPLGIDISHTKRVSNELFHGRVLRMAMNPIDHLRQLFSITEAAPRVAELRALANELGWTPGTKMTPDQATQLALAAKQVTTDFSAMGDVSRIVNAAVPFDNPAIQGMRSFARAFQNNPARSVLWGTAVFTVPTLLNWWRNKDEAWYQALPWREKYTYTNIDDGKSIWRIPRPFDWGNVFMVMPEAILDSWYRHDPTAAKAAMSHVFETQNPLDYPVLLKLAKEQWENNISFWDRPIVPRGEVDLPASMQVGPYTSQLAIGINKAFPNLSPRRVDAALRGYFGGVYSDLVGGLGLTATQADREWERSDIPVLGVLFRRGGEFNAQNQNISDFYDAYIPAKAKVDAQVQQIKRAAMGQPGGNALVVTPADRLAAGVGEDAAKAISTLVRLANVAKDYNARTQLYKQANDMALRALTVMRNAQAPAKGK